MANRIYLFLETNCYAELAPPPRPTWQERVKLWFGLTKPGPHTHICPGSILIARDSYDPDPDAPDHYSEHTTRLLGPVEFSQAQQRFKELGDILRRAGVEVVEEYVCDD